jgi:hypothetical protein
MLAAIMIGAVVITYFAADIVNKSKIDTLTSEHNVEIRDVYSKNENFTDNFLQGSVVMDSAREVREVANLNFDFALFWFNNALANVSVWYNNEWVNDTSNLTKLCIENCTLAMNKYLISYDKFGSSRPHFMNARNYTVRDRYLEVLGYYVDFSKAGQNITLLRYNASKFLKQAAENLSLGNSEVVVLLMENFTMMENMYIDGLGGFEELKKVIDEYAFFDEIREEH